MPRNAVPQKDIGTVEGKHRGASYRRINGKDYEVFIDENGQEQLVEMQPLETLQEFPTTVEKTSKRKKVS